jgi:tripartite-type tricarboxylate transporter receptor subunit TctC
MVVLIHPSVPATTVPQFIAYAKANPGKINMASSGSGAYPTYQARLYGRVAHGPASHPGRD